MAQPATSIFGIDPRLLATGGQKMADFGQGLLSTLNTLNPFATLAPGWNSPDPLPGESPYAYQHRMRNLQAARGLENFAGNVVSEVGKAVNYVGGSEQQAQQQRAAAKPKTPSAASVFPHSYADPKWDELEKMYGGDVAPLLRQVRLYGEKSNSDQVNAATGASTPYQITADTRRLFLENPGYKFDPWASPENAVKAAAQVLRDHGGAKDPMRAVAGYFGGRAGANNPFSSATDANGMSIHRYVQNVLFGEGGKGGVMVNPFDPGYLQQAAGQINAATQAAMTPTKSVFGGKSMPEMPKPEPTPKTDFSVADANLEALRPVEMAEHEAKDIQWKNFWSGLGRAMASSPEGEGLGSFFLRLGGGALMAKGAAADEIQQRKDAYDVKLAKFNAALYEHNLAKAQVVHNELLADWQANQGWIANKYQQELGIWKSNSQVQLVGNQLVNQSIDPKTGNVTVTTTPVKSLVLADDARDKANIAMQAFGVQNSANNQVAGLANRIQGQIVMGKAAQVLANEQATASEKSAAAAFGPLPVVKYVVDKQLMSSVLGPDELEGMNEDIITQLSGAGMMPGTKEYISAYREAAIGRMLVAIQDPATFQRLMQQFGQAADLYGNYERSINTTERVQTKAGNQTFTTTVEGE